MHCGHDDGATVRSTRGDHPGQEVCAICPPWRGENASRRHDKAYSSRTRKAGK